MKTGIITNNKLKFEILPWDSYFNHFQVGTVDGIFGYGETNGQITSIDILGIQNTMQGNGHFEDAMQWFEYAAQQDYLALRFLVVMNPSFLIHLVEKRGFKVESFFPDINLIKHYPRPEAWAEISASRLFW